MTTGLIVGAGPNGLAAAVTLARAGVEVTVLEAACEVGGGARSGELTVPGLLHDHCSAVHPFAAASPFLRGLDLARHGLTWLRAPIDLAHPLDGGRAAVMTGSPADTAAGLGRDGQTWLRLFDGLTRNVNVLIDEIMAPLIHLPRHPLELARMTPALLPAAAIARLLRTAEGRALWGGICAHSFQPLAKPLTSAMGLMFVAVNNAYGWPVARGGSRAITDALARLLAELGGKIETGVRVGARADLPPADITLFDLMPGAVADILGDTLPARVRRAYRRYQFGPGAFKLDLAVAGGVPWTDERCGRAGTVHVGGSYQEIVRSERDTNAGRMPERPFVIVGQQYLADPSRSHGDLHPLYAYAHVPHGFTGDATSAILDRIESFAPGFRTRIVARTVTTPADFAAGNANLVGGDVIGGAATARQLAARPRLAPDPYFTGVPGYYLCSAAAWPGAGAHGMAGHNAADRALRRHTRTT